MLRMKSKGQKPRKRQIKNAQCVEFARILKQFRAELKLSQEAFAFLLGFNRVYYGELERAQKEASLTTILKIARALKMQPAQLLQQGSWNVIEEPRKKAED